MSQPGVTLLKIRQCND